MKDENITDNAMPTEVPIITIERDEQHQQKPRVPSPTPRRTRWIIYVGLCVVAIALALIVIIGYKQWAYYNSIGVPVSVSPEENIEKLQRQIDKEQPKVVMTTDNILGVALNIYAIHGLQAAIEFEEPDTTDKSVYLYCRSIDFTAEGRYLSSLVASGKEYASNNFRLGYMAMAGGNSVIGISRHEDVKDYTIENTGSFFRQFILVSNGELPPRFYLHGKVERCAIGRIGDRLYYINSCNKETLWSFADALREYGFIDAIYITGGTDYSFYRDCFGNRHDIHDPNTYPHKKWKGIIPWLVFRKR